MKPHSRRLIILPLLLVSACESDQQRSATLLDQRLQAQLAPDIAAQKAAVQRLPDGARVTLLDPSLFPIDMKTQDNRKIDVRSGVIQALLDPDLMRVQVADTSALADDQRDARVRNVVQYFADYGLAPTLRPAEPLPPGSAATPAGVAISISVVCPHRDDGTGYDDGQRKPDCE